MEALKNILDLKQLVTKYPKTVKYRSNQSIESRSLDLLPALSKSLRGLDSLPLIVGCQQKFLHSYDKLLIDSQRRQIEFGTMAILLVPLQ